MYENTNSDDEKIYCLSNLVSVVEALKHFIQSKIDLQISSRKSVTGTVNVNQKNVIEDDKGE